MHWNLDYKITLIVLLFLGEFAVVYADSLPSKVLQCDYADSLNITGGILLPNKNILFRRVMYPENQYAKINYSIFENEIIPEDPYYRGCICNIKSCIRMCCPYGSYLEIKNNAGMCLHNDAAKRIDGDIINQNNETKRIKYHDHFAILHRFQCRNLHMRGENYSITHVSASNCLPNGRNLTKMKFAERRCYCRQSNIKSP